MTTDPGPSQHKASLLDTVKAIAWAFFGVRGKRAHEHDVSRLNPVHVIIVGLLLAAVFVLTLVAIAVWVAG